MYQILVTLPNLQYNLACETILCGDVMERNHDLY